MKKSLFAFTLLAGLALAGTASAGIIKYDVILTGANDANGSTAVGEAFLTLDDVANTLNLTMTFSGLQNPASAAHIHCCAVPPVNAPVVLPFPSFPSLTAGSYTQLFNISSTITAGIKSGQSYINIHDQTFPGGEIRGNILAAAVATPEPATMGLFGCALIGIAALRRRKSIPSKTNLPYSADPEGARESGIFFFARRSR